MAIQPVDLQLAYLAAPATGAVASAAQGAPAAAQAAAQAAFAAQVEKREETVAETARTPDRGNRINADADGGGSGGTYSPRKRHRGAYRSDTEEELAVEPAATEQHFIDTTA